MKYFSQYYFSVLEWRSPKIYIVRHICNFKFSGSHILKSEKKQVKLTLINSILSNPTCPKHYHFNM